MTSASRLPQRKRHAVEVRADDQAGRAAAEREHRAVLVGEHDCLRAAANRRADVTRGIDAGDIRRAADVAHRAVEARLGDAEGEAIAEAADRQRIAPAMERQRAAAARAADDEAGLEDAEADAAAVGKSRG